MHFKLYQVQYNDILWMLSGTNFTKYNRFSSAYFLWRHDATFRQKLTDKDMKARHVDCFHDN